MTDADRQIRDTVSRDGIHIVHVWAPWCDNSLRELEPVWAHDTGADSVTFVTVWNDGQSGAETLAEHDVVLTGLGHGVTEVVVPGPKPETPDRRMTLYDLPVTWIPTTWVFNRGGMLATAFNHGEITRAQLAEAINGARSDW